MEGIAKSASVFERQRELEVSEGLRRAAGRTDRQVEKELATCGAADRQHSGHDAGVAVNGRASPGGFDH